MSILPSVPDNEWAHPVVHEDLAEAIVVIDEWAHPVVHEDLAEASVVVDGRYVERSAAVAVADVDGVCHDAQQPSAYFQTFIHRNT